MKRALPSKCKVLNELQAVSHVFRNGKITKLSGWVRGRENEEVFGLLEPTSFPWVAHHLQKQTRRFAVWANC